MHFQNLSCEKLAPAKYFDSFTAVLYEGCEVFLVTVRFTFGRLLLTTTNATAPGHKYITGRSKLKNPVRDCSWVEIYPAALLSLKLFSLMSLSCSKMEPRGTNSMLRYVLRGILPKRCHSRVHYTGERQYQIGHRALSTRTNSICRYCT
jgi:hypothetical protein